MRPGKERVGPHGETGPDRAAGRGRVDGAQIAERAGCTGPTAIKWCRRYTEAGLTGLETRRAQKARSRC